ncbi:MAG TPA: DUF4177 domain-containing protein [Candidatus Kapabacteria bacterium]|nr:DUF4177 domain-containing protein [Candidatus Kapabacteria bacterium]
MEWEYNNIVIEKSIRDLYIEDKSKLNKILNEHGKEGWELASTATSLFHILFVFKRPKK